MTRNRDLGMDLSIVFPVYHERDSVSDTVHRAVAVGTEMGVQFEVITVDDGSQDGTREALQELADRFPGTVRLVTHPYNKGNGAAIRTGILAARGRIIACMDADGQHDPADILRLYPYMDDYDLVVGARTPTYRGALHRNLANRLYNAFASWLTQFRIEDLTSGYRLFRADVVLHYVHLFPARFSYPTTSTLALIKGGHNVKYVGIDVRARRGNHSKIRIFRDGWRFLVIIVKIIVIFEPLRVFLPTAFILGLLAVASTAYSISSLGRLHIPNSAVLLFLVAVLVVLLGFLGEQIAALQVSRRHHDSP